MSFANAKCVHCGKPISFTRQFTFEGVCEDWKCRDLQVGVWAKKQRELEEQRRQQRFQAATQAWDETVAAEPSNLETGSTQPGSWRVFPVPASRRTLVELPEHRRDEFISHLNTCVQSSFEKYNLITSIEISPEDIEDEQNAATPSPVLSWGCGTCHGHCCRLGGTHAFLSEELMTRRRRADPSLTAQQLVTQYSSYLQPTSIDDSCVFHQPTGCALPRNLRARICNSFECQDLHEIRMHSGEGPVVIVAIDDDHAVVRMTKVFPEASGNTGS